VLWGATSTMNINKEKANLLIQKYVQNTYPLKVKQYHDDLNTQKKEKLDAIKDVVYIQKNLMWQDQPVNITLKLNELEFKRYCKKLAIANREDWRVPQYFELLSLVDYGTTNPASSEKIKYIKSTKYWTATQSILNKKKNWYVDFKYGKTSVASDLKRYHIRCVREISQEEGNY